MYEWFHFDGDEVVTLELAAGSERADWWILFLNGLEFSEPVQAQGKQSHRIDLAEVGPTAMEIKWVFGNDLTFTATCSKGSAAAPTIDTIFPSSGTVAGGEAVLIRGTSFTTASSVTFDGLAATNLMVHSDSDLTVTVPPHAAGTVDVEVKTLAGSATLSKGFTYVEPSSNDLLSGLAISHGALSPGFDPQEMTYTVDVASEVEEISITPTVADPRATVTINGMAAQSGVPTAPLALGAEITTFTVQVTAQDGSTRSYSITVNRADPGKIVARDFTVEAPHGARAITIDMVGHVDGPAKDFQLNLTDLFSVKNLTSWKHTPRSSIFALALGPDGFVENHTIRYDVCVEYTTGCTRSVSGGVVSLIVTNVPAAPSIVSVSGPPAGIYKVGDTLAFAVTFDQPVTVIGTPMLMLVADTSGVNAAYSGGSGSTRLTFSHAVQPETNASEGIALSSLSANGGRIQGAGRDADLTLRGVSDLSGVRIDTLAPTVRNTAVIGTPAPGATEVNFAVEFSEPVTGVSPSDFEIFAIGNVRGAITNVSGSGDRYTVRLSGITGIGQIRLDVRTGGAIADTAGNVLAVPFVTGRPWTRLASTDATLVSLQPAVGTLSPDFSPGTTAYAIAVANAVEGITLTPTAADASATIMVGGNLVPSGGQSAPVSLPVGRTAIPIVVTAGDGTTTQTYTVTVIRAAASDNADLSDLRTNLGVIDPAFAPDQAAYTVTVASDVETLVFTPTAADANATIKVNGVWLASGTPSAPISLAVGVTSVVIVVTSQDETNVRTYTVSIERARPIPTGVSRTIEVLAGTTVTVGLADAATGGPFTNAAIIAVSDARAGSLHLGRGQQLVFNASPTFAGASNVTFTLTNASGTSQPAIITFTVVARPDPAKDPDVTGLLNAQVSAARRLAQNQIRNFNDRLEQLRDEAEQRRNSARLNLSMTGRNPTGHASFAEEPHVLDPAVDAMRHIAGRPRGMEPASGASNGAARTTRFAVWSGGYINLARSDEGGIDFGSTMVGVSGGVDYRFSSSFVAGLGLGYGRDISIVGDRGTESRASAWSMAGYASYKPRPGFFIDGLFGLGAMTFDSRRFVAADGGTATGVRDGRQFFGSVTTGYEHRAEGWLVSPYGRLDASRSLLAGFSEAGGGVYGLAYGNQSINTLSASVGLRLEYALTTDWGLLKPRGRLEYSHDFEGPSRVALGYADIGAFSYGIDFDAHARDRMAIGLGFDARFGERWSLGFDYRTGFGGGGNNRDQTFALKVGTSF